MGLSLTAAAAAAAFFIYRGRNAATLTADDAGLSEALAPSTVDAFAAGGAIDSFPDGFFDLPTTDTLAPAPATVALSPQYKAGIGEIAQLSAAALPMVGWRFNRTPTPAPTTTLPTAKAAIDTLRTRNTGATGAVDSPSTRRYTPPTNTRQYWSTNPVNFAI